MPEPRKPSRPLSKSSRPSNKRPSPKPIDDEDIPRNQKRFPIQRNHLGMIKFLREEDSFGFIESENFRDDVFFHFTVFEGNIERNGVMTKVEIEMDLWVEFELDEEMFRNEEKLRAKVVRPTSRPRGRKLSGRDATFNVATRHPKARKKRPTWRNKD